MVPQFGWGSLFGDSVDWRVGDCVALDILCISGIGLGQTFLVFLG